MSYIKEIKYNFCEKQNKYVSETIYSDDVEEEIDVTAVGDLKRSYINKNGKVRVSDEYVSYLKDNYRGS